MDIKLKIKEVFQLIDYIIFKGIYIEMSSNYQKILSLSKEIISFYGLPSDDKNVWDLIGFIYNANFTDQAIDQVMNDLTEKAKSYHSGTNFSKNLIELDSIQLAPADQDSNAKYEEPDITEKDDEILNKAMEKSWQEIKAKKDEEKQMKNSENEPPSIISDEVKDYVVKHLYLPLSDEEFADIETGFRIRWNYSTGQIAGDGDFVRAVDQYLIEIESPLDRKKMRKVVDLILEYLGEIGEWGDK